MTDSPPASQRRAARSRIWAAGSFGEAAKSNPSRVASVSNRARRIRRCQGHGLAAGDLVLAQDLEEVQVAEFPGAGLGEAGVEGGEHAGQLQLAQRGRERAAVGDRDGGGHDGAPSAVTGVTASLGIVPGRGMTFANEAGPRRNAAAPPSPAAAGSWSRSAPAARMPRTVR